ncbi:hypothetical protein BU26DRAFT_353269 [Trematosphaeria pertusa]|uniref:Uncharacterized protein n=1 Tax=Trematosphaeria pertusa TaxID=390896 RepID=A0A6A6IDX3_9PLEO|nr:uncharacterized protein BU26DRAFT_353269 [Trematosphaeria pertusa]KAF2247770.1 hypothetical protein BU26DRAFT_353269 [Trematosphaeria pertusa]
MKWFRRKRSQLRERFAPLTEIWWVKIANGRKWLMVEVWLGWGGAPRRAEAELDETQKSTICWLVSVVLVPPRRLFFRDQITGREGTWLLEQPSSSCSSTVRILRFVCRYLPILYTALVRKRPDQRSSRYPILAPPTVRLLQPLVQMVLSLQPLLFKPDLEIAVRCLLVWPIRSFIIFETAQILQQSAGSQYSASCDGAIGVYLELHVAMIRIDGCKG